MQDDRSLPGSYPETLLTELNTSPRYNTVVGAQNINRVS